MEDELKKKLKTPLDSMPLMACVTSWMKEVEVRNNIQGRALVTIEHLEGDNRMLADIAKIYGGHANNCNYVEEVSSGRILKDDEEILCDCGWYDTKKMLDKRAEGDDSSLLVSPLEPVAK